MADLPAHVLVARVVAEYGNPVLRFSDYFTIDWTVAPTALFYLVLVPLQQLLGPFWDSRVYLIAWVALTWLSTWYLARVLGRHDPWLAALVALPLAFCWYAYNGFLPFLMSLPLFVTAVGVWASTMHLTVRVPLLATLLLAVFGFHIVGAAAAGMVVALGSLTRVLVLKHRPIELVWTGVAVTPLVAFTGLYLLGRQSPTATASYRPFLDHIVDIVKFTCATLDDAATVVMLIWLASLGLIFVARRRDLGRHVPILAGALALIALALVLPGSLGALYPAGPRLLPFALVLLIASVEWSALRPVRVIAGFLILVAGLSVLTTRRAAEVDQGFQDLVAGLDAVEPGRRVLPIIADQFAGSRWTKPYLHVGDVFVILRGGTNPYVFAEPHILTGASPLKYKRAAEAREYAFMYDGPRDPTDYRGVSDYYDYVLLWGASAPIASVIREDMTTVYSRGYVTLFARRAAALGRHRDQPPAGGRDGQDR